MSGCCVGGCFLADEKDYQKWDEVEAEPRRRKSMHDSGQDPDQEVKVRSLAQLEQRHLEVYRDLHRLKDQVHSQREQRQETARAKSEKETKQKQKLASSKLQRSNSYLKSLPKSSYYLIFDLQKQLAQRGRLKTHQDLEDFHRSIDYTRPPSQLHKNMEDVRRRMLENGPAAHLMTQHKTSEKHPCTIEDRGHKDPSRCRPPTMLLKQGSGSEEIFHDGQEEDETEQMFPKMKAPTFATLQLNFMRSFRSKMPDLIIPEIPEKSMRAEMYVRRLRKMHHLCLINMACSQRLLDRETDSLCWQEERGNRDLILPGIDSKPGKKSRTRQLPPSSPTQAGSIRSDQPSCPLQPSRMTSASLETLVRDTPCSRKTPEPLSMDDVCRQKNVKIIDCGFKLWRNYTETTDQ